ncbi:pyridoxamine 5'-phosphate oxidase family protein [Streptomyces melanogenes]|uniref:Pyridoxamine 5'-phosphate oxidase family protein n=1 Tax=Streptomyces melanogenes TaxID=67326 RepID=A0ABZ1XNP8_9ACTN|nr:pyridoxamine 5'-phosphate oxidase family protein [Streptomyces melanogenes]
MTPPPAARTLDERIKDTCERFENDVDTWVSTASPDGTPYLVPLSFLWDGTTFLLSTVRTSPTGRNLVANPAVRLAFGTTRDVVLVEGTAAPIEEAALDSERANAFATRTGFDPREEKQEYLYFRVTPQRIQTWREANELVGRTVMRAGGWRV